MNTLLIGVEATKTPAQNSETGETPQARSGEECLERKSTTKFNRAKEINILIRTDEF